MSLLGWSPNLPKTPLTDRRGYIQPVWIRFLEALYVRVGGASAPTTLEVAAALTAQTESYAHMFLLMGA